MVRRRDRKRVVFDTNVFVRAILSARPDSVNRQAVKVWIVSRELQLVVSSELIAEYLRLLETVVGLGDQDLRAWEARFCAGDRVSLVELGPHVTGCRDPDDDLLLSVAAAGRAEFLVTNDRDLLELPRFVKQRLQFDVVTPRRFLEQVKWLI